MTAWQLDPAGVRVVLDQVVTDAEALSTAFGQEQQQQAVRGVSWGFEWTQDVPAALSGLFADAALDVESVVNRVVGSVVGVTAAVSSYRSGAQDMDEVQRQTLASAADGDLSWFEQRGFVPGQP